jgi:hypothetical protein
MEACCLDGNFKLDGVTQIIRACVADRGWGILRAETSVFFQIDVAPRGGVESRQASVDQIRVLLNMQAARGLQVGKKRKRGEMFVALDNDVAEHGAHRKEDLQSILILGLRERHDVQGPNERVAGALAIEDQIGGGENARCGTQRAAFCALTKTRTNVAVLEPASRSRALQKE